MSVDISIVTEPTAEVLEALHKLVPQLSNSATPLTLEQLKEVVTSPTNSLFIARSEGVICGTLTLVVFRTPGGKKAWIEDVIVDEEARGLGVGEMLGNAAIDRAREMGASAIDLTSRPSREAANRLYVRIGFHTRETNVYRFSLEG